MPLDNEHNQSGNLDSTVPLLESVKTTTDASHELSDQDKLISETIKADHQINDARERKAIAAPEAPVIDSPIDSTMMNEKLTAASSPTPSVSPITPQVENGAGWLTRVFRNRQTDPREALLPRPQMATSEPGNYVETPRTGAAQALARASGLSAQSTSGPVLTALAIVLGVTLLGSVYLFYRHQAFSSRADASALTLVAPDEKIQQLVQTAEQAIRQDNYSLAIESYKQAIQLSPDNAPLMMNLGKIYGAAGRYDEALQTYSRLIELDSKNLEAREERALIYWANRATQEWEQELRQIIRLAPNSQQANRALSMLEMATLGRGSIYTAQRRTARNTFFGPNLPYSNGQPTVNMPLPELPLSAIGPQPTATNNSALDDHVGAQELVSFHKERGNRLQNVGEYKAALKHFEDALKLTPDDKDLYYFIASTYKRAGQDALAHEYYKKCDSGTYAAVARDGAKKTEKAAREAAKKGLPLKPGS
ncbi:MAG TPA: tetratricopeptide repeat protein, partial [Blastocatellia bacterium]|nr:tetratricopeptide repeat protein [Blastocatellia bacterium]